MTEMTISTQAELVTVISTFAGEPAHHADLLALLERNAAALLTQIDGFLGASIHLSADGTRIINYAQWADAEALQTMLADPRIRQHQADLAALATVEPVRCTVRSVHRPTT
jgi:quinol monooxygenase YgiN